MFEETYGKAAVKKMQVCGWHEHGIDMSIVQNLHRNSTIASKSMKHLNKDEKYAAYINT
jgi:hypothetical protein